MLELLPGSTVVLAECWQRVIEPRPYPQALFAVALFASIYIHGLGAIAAPCGFDDEPNNIDTHHERLWAIADGEIARCTMRARDAVAHPAGVTMGRLISR